MPTHRQTPGPLPLLEPLEFLDVSTLRPHPRNDGFHSPDELAHLRESIVKHGIYRNVVVAQDGTILAGHGVVQAAHELGLSHVPGQRMSYAPDAPEALALLVGDNHIARLREQDDAALTALLQEIAEDDPLALLGTGYDAEALAALVAAHGLGHGMGTGDAGRDVAPQIDRAAELQEHWGTAHGQLWACGAHRILCGNCTDKAVVERLVARQHVSLVLADPPYNVGFEYGVASDGDAKSDEGYRVFTHQWFVLCQQISPKQIVTPGCYNLASWLQLFPAFYVACWIKTNAMTHGYISRFFCWEPILFFGGEWFTGNETLWPRHRTNDVFDYPIGAQSALGMGSLSPYHPCPKPLKLWSDFLEYYSLRDDRVYDPFLGSGTTLIACENLSRICYGCEIDPGYVAVSLERWHLLTGNTPTLLGSSSG